MRLVRAAAITGLLTLLLAAPALAGIAIADLSVTKTDSPDPVAAGANLTYTITVANSDNSTAANIILTDLLPAGTTFVSFSTPAAGWTLTTPPVGGTGNVQATNAAFAANDTAVFTLVLNVDAGIKPGIITNTATVSSTTSDPDPTNNAATATTTVTGPAPTPVASLADAAMAAPSTGSPLAILGFAVLLVGLLATTALMAVRRIRT